MSSGRAGRVATAGEEVFEEGVAQFDSGEELEEGAEVDIVGRCQ